MRVLSLIPLLFAALLFVAGVATCAGGALALGLGEMAAAVMLGMFSDIHAQAGRAAEALKTLVELAREEKEDRAAMLTALQKMAEENELHRHAQASHASQQIARPRAPAKDPVFEAAIAAELDGGKKPLR